MKYIRTKDGVYEVEGRKFYDALKRKHYITTKGLAIKEDDIIKQSENLEELCDCAVETKGDTGDYKHYIYEGERYEKLKPKIIDDIRTQDFNVFGAIWTDKGLIYVAKMNDKGVLELI